MATAYFTMNTGGRRITQNPFYQQMTPQPTPDHETNIVLLDHCYAKPWSAHPHATNARPAKFLYMAKYGCPSVDPLKHKRSTAENQRYVTYKSLVVSHPPAWSNWKPVWTIVIIISIVEKQFHMLNHWILFTTLQLYQYNCNVYYYIHLSEICLKFNYLNMKHFMQTNIIYHKNS